MPAAIATVSATSLLQTLRAASLRRWVVACVLMAWGSVWAAPLLQPPGLHVVCGANGHVKLVAAATAGEADSAAVHDCPLCTPPSLVPAALPLLPDPMAAEGSAAFACPPPPQSATTGTLPPARGPPVH